MKTLTLIFLFGFCSSIYSQNKTSSYKYLYNDYKKSLLLHQPRNGYEASVLFLNNGDTYLKTYNNAYMFYMPKPYEDITNEEFKKQSITYFSSLLGLYQFKAGRIDHVYPPATLLTRSALGKYLYGDTTKINIGDRIVRLKTKEGTIIYNSCEKYKDRTGFYLSNESGVFKFHKDSLIKVFNKSENNDYTKLLLIDSNERYWFSSNKNETGIISSKSDNTENYPYLIELKARKFKGMIEYDEQLYCAFGKSGFYIFKDNKWFNFNTKNSELLSNNIIDVKYNESIGLCVLTNKGVNTFKDNIWTSANIPSEAIFNNKSELYIGENNLIHIKESDTTFCVVKNNRIIRFGITNYLKNFYNVDINKFRISPAIKDLNLQIDSDNNGDRWLITEMTFDELMELNYLLLNKTIDLKQEIDSFISTYNDDWKCNNLELINPSDTLKDFTYYISKSGYSSFDEFFFNILYLNIQFAKKVNISPSSWLKNHVFIYLIKKLDEADDEYFVSVIYNVRALPNSYGCQYSSYYYPRNCPNTINNSSNSSFYIGKHATILEYK